MSQQPSLDEQPVDQAPFDEHAAIMTEEPDPGENPTDQASSDGHAAVMLDAPDVDEQPANQAPSDGHIIITTEGLNLERQHPEQAPSHEYSVAMNEESDAGGCPVDQPPSDEPEINCSDWDGNHMSSLGEDGLGQDDETIRAILKLTRVRLPASSKAPTPAPADEDGADAVTLDLETGDAADGLDQEPDKGPPPRRVGELRNKRKRENTDTGRENSRPPPRRQRHSYPCASPVPTNLDGPVQRREMPKRENFFGPEPRNRLRGSHYVWGPPPEPADPSTFPKFARHPRLNVPDPMDDSDKPGSTNFDVFNPCARRPRSNACDVVANINKRRIERQRAAEERLQKKRAQKERLRSERADAEALLVANRPKNCSLAGVPTEVREKIMRHLLVSEDPVPVFENWTKVYRSTRRTRRSHQPISTVLFSEPEAFNLHPAILSVCKQFFWEGARILYGENKFLYRLRDRPMETARPPIDAERLATDDSPQDENGEPMDLDFEEGDSGSEYEDEAAPSTAMARRSARNGRGKYIVFEKYMPLMRQIVVEAEHNRHGDETKALMGNAIAAFNGRIHFDSKNPVPIHPRGPGQRALKHSLANIHTLTLRVHPMALGYEQESDHPAFTFTEFFSPDSPILKAANDLLPQFVRVEILTGHLVQGTKNMCLFVDLRPVRVFREIRRGAIDMWAGDEAMMRTRREKLHVCGEAFKDLEERVTKLCVQRIAEAEEDFTPEWQLEDF